MPMPWSLEPEYVVSHGERGFSDVIRTENLKIVKWSLDFTWWREPLSVLSPARQRGTELEWESGESRSRQNLGSRYQLWVRGLPGRTRENPLGTKSKPSRWPAVKQGVSTIMAGTSILPASRWMRKKILLQDPQLGARWTPDFEFMRPGAETPAT